MAQAERVGKRAEDSSANADNVWFFPATIVMDAQRYDVLKFFGIPLTGGAAAASGVMLIRDFAKDGGFVSTIGGFQQLAATHQAFTGEGPAGRPSGFPSGRGRHVRDSCRKIWGCPNFGCCNCARDRGLLQPEALILWEESWGRSHKIGFR